MKMVEVTNIKCVKKGKDYYATVKGIRLRYMVDQDNTKVTVCGPEFAYGAFSLDRIGGKLSPETIRKLHN